MTQVAIDSERLWETMARVDEFLVNGRWREALELMRACMPILETLARVEGRGDPDGDDR